VEVITSTDYRRDQLTVAFDEASSTLNIVGRADALTRERISGIFDLDTDRRAIERHLQLSPAFLPGAWCPFELGVRAILGQADQCRSRQNIDRTPSCPNGDHTRQTCH